MKFYRQKLKLVESAPFTRSRLLTEAPEDEMPTDPQAPPPQAPAMDASPLPEEPEAQPGTEPADTPEAQTEEPDDKTLAIKVHASGKVTDPFRIAVKNALLTFPPELRKIVSDHGYTVSVLENLAELQSELDEPVQVPLERLSSAFVRVSKEIAIAENIKNEDGSNLPTLNPAGVIRHAFGHAVDELAPFYLKGSDKAKFSDLESFKYAHVSDIGRIAEDKKRKLAFYVEDEDAGRSECFSECIAALHEGGSTYTIEVMSQYFPAVMKQVKDTIEAIKSNTKIIDKDGDGIPDETQVIGEPKSKKPAEPIPAEKPEQTPAETPEAAPEADEAPEEPQDDAGAPETEAPDQEAPEADEAQDEPEDAEPEVDDGAGEDYMQDLQDPDEAASGEQDSKEPEAEEPEKDQSEEPEEPKKVEPEGSDDSEPDDSDEDEEEDEEDDESYMDDLQDPDEPESAE